MSGHDRESGRSEGENDFASLEHLAYLEHTEYRVPMRNSGWGEEEEEREILKQIFDELEISTQVAPEAEGLAGMKGDETTELPSVGVFEESIKETNGSSTTSRSSSSSSRSPSREEVKAEGHQTSSAPTSNWQGRVNFVTRGPTSIPTSASLDQTQEAEIKAGGGSVSNPEDWRIRFEMEEKPGSKIRNQAVETPELDQEFDQGPEVEMPKHNFEASPEFEVSTQREGKDASSTTFPRSIEIFETMPPCDTEFCE